MSYYPMTCCDRECACDNNCIVGGIRCGACDHYFCADDIDDDGLCPACAEAKREEEEQ